MPGPNQAPPPVNAPANVPSLRKLGTGITDAAAGDDVRLATPTNAQLTPAAGKIPLADGTGKINSGWIDTSAFVPSTRQIIAGTGLTGGGNLTADRTISMPNVGPGAGTYGGGANFVNSVTLDAQGRVTAVAVTNPSAGTGYHTIMEDAVALTQRNTLNFGTGLLATDDSGNTRTNVVLADTAVTPGSYTNANITVDAQGRITAAANGSGGGGTPGGANTQLQFNDSGAFGGDADLTWDKTGNVLAVLGNVGIGTSSPTSFTGYRTLELRHDTNGAAFVLSHNGAQGRVVYDTNGLLLEANTARPIRIKAGAASGPSDYHMIVQTNGRIGFNTSLDYAFPTSQGSNTFLRNDGSGNLTWVAGTGSTSPGGSDTQIQFNDAGVFGGDADFTWNKTTNTLALQNQGLKQANYKGVVDSLLVQTQASNTRSAIAVAPSGTSENADIVLFNSSSITTNWSSLNIGYAGDSFQHWYFLADKGGTGTVRPIAFSAGETTFPLKQLVLATNGRIGIGTNAPDELLHVYGAASTDGIFKISSNAGATNTKLRVIDGADGGLQIQRGDSTALMTFNQGATMKVMVNQTVFGVRGVEYVWPNAQGGANTFLRNDGSGNLTWVSGTGSTSPGGSDTHIQFNDGGAFGGDSDFTWNKTTNTLTLQAQGLSQAALVGGILGLKLQSQTTNARTMAALVPNGTSRLADLLVYATSDITNYEYLNIGFDETSNKHTILTSAGGTGTVRPLAIGANGSLTQLVLATDGNVGIGITNSPAQLIETNGNIEVGRLATGSTFNRKVGIGGTSGAMTETVTGGSWIRFDNLTDGSNTISFITHENTVFNDIAATFLKGGELELYKNLARIRNVAYSWPSSQGGSGTVLTNNGSGNLTWTTPTGASEPNTQLVYGTGSGVDSSANFTFDSGTGVVGLHSYGLTQETWNSIPSLRIRSASSNARTLVMIRPNGTPAAGASDIALFATDDVVNYSQLLIGWESNDSSWYLNTQAGGSGVRRALKLGAQGTFPPTQLMLQTDGRVGLNNVNYTWPSSQGGAATFLRNDGSGGLTWASVTAGPGGSDTQLQYNDGGSLAGDAGMVWNKTTKLLTITNTLTAASRPTLLVVGAEENNRVMNIKSTNTAGWAAIGYQNSSGSVKMDLGYVNPSPTFGFYANFAGRNIIVGDASTDIIIGQHTTSSPFAGRVDMMIKAATGRVGVGTDNPQAKLYVRPTSGVTSISVGSSTDGGVPNGNAAYALSNGVDSDWGIAPIGSGEIRQRTGAAGRWMSFAPGDGTTNALAIKEAGIAVGSSTVTSMLNVGASQQFQVNSSGDIVKLKNITYSWPSSQGGASTFLQNDGSGNLSWVAGGGSVSEPDTQIVYGTGSAIDSSADFKYDYTNKLLKLKGTRQRIVFDNTTRKGRFGDNYAGTDSDSLIFISSNLNYDGTDWLKDDTAATGVMAVIRTDGESNAGFDVNISAPGANPATLVNKLRVNKDGYVGINNLTPDAQLHVKGYKVHGGINTVIALDSGDNTIDTGITFDRNGTSYWAWNLRNASESNKLNLYEVGGGNPARLTVLQGGNIGVGTQTPTARFHVVHTHPTSPGVAVHGVTVDVTSAGSQAFLQGAFRAILNAGYTGSASTTGADINNVVVAGTGNNFGMWSYAGDGNSTGTFIGVRGTGGNANASGKRIGGFFDLGAGTATMPVSGALVANNGTTTDPIFVGLDNNSVVFQVSDGGDLTKIRNVTYSWPSAQGASNTFLRNDGSGNLTWTTVPGGSIDGSGSANRVAYWSDADTLTSSANLTFNGSSMVLTGSMAIDGIASQALNLTVNNGVNGLKVTNASDSTLIITPVGSGQMRVKTDVAGRWMSFADGDGTVDALTIKDGIVRVGAAQGLKQGTAPGAITALILQSTTTNARTSFAVVPNGTSVDSNITVFNSSDPTTNYAGLTMGWYDPELSFYISTTKGGTGTQRPIKFSALASFATQFALQTDGKIGLNGVDYAWPASQGGASTVLTNDGSGNLSWSAAGTGTVTGTGAANRIAYWSGTSALTSNAGFTFDGQKFMLGHDTTGTRFVVYKGSSAPTLSGDPNMFGEFHTTSNVMSHIWSASGGGTKEYNLYFLGIGALRGYNDYMAVSTGQAIGSEIFVWKGTKHGIGHNNPDTTLSVYNSDTSFPRGILSLQANAGTHGSNLHLRKARGTIATPTAVTNGDNIGSIYFEGRDPNGSVNYEAGASIHAISNGTVANGSVPMDLSFRAGSTGGGSEIMRLTSGGKVAIGLASPGSTAKVHIRGSASGSVTAPTDDNMFFILDKPSTPGNAVNAFINLASSNDDGGWIIGEEGVYKGGIRWHRAAATLGITANGGTSNAITVKSTNVGINEPDPSTSFQIEKQGLSQATMFAIAGLKVQSQTTNARTLVAIVPNGTSNLADLVLSSTSDLTNYSTINLGYDGGNNAWALASYKGGTGTVRPIRIGADYNTNPTQLVLNTDSSISSTTSVVNGLTLVGPNATVASGNANLYMFTSDTHAANKGAAIMLGATTNGTGNPLPMAYIWGRKENGTANNQDGYLAFGVRNNGTGGAVEVGRFGSNGVFAVGATSSEFQVNNAGNLIKIRSVDYSWPSANAAGVLTNNGSGTLSWSAAGTGTVTGTGVANRVAYWDGTSNITSDADLTFDGTTLAVSSQGLSQVSFGDPGLLIQPTTNNTRVVVGIAPKGTPSAGATDFILYSTSDFTTNKSSLNHGYDTNNNVWYIGTEAAGSGVRRPIAMGADGVFPSKQLYFTTTGLLGSGTTNPLTQLHVADAATAFPHGITSSNHSASAQPGLFIGQKSRGTNASPLAIANGDYVAGLSSYAYDGNSYEGGGGLLFKINGTVADGSVPTDMEFWTGTVSGGSLRMVLASGGQLSLGSSTITSMFNVGSSAQFQVDSSGNIVKLNNVTTSFPASQGGANTFLRNDGSGNLTWVTAPGTVDGSGAANRLAYWSDADTLTSDADLTFDGTVLTLAGRLVTSAGSLGSNHGSHFQGTLDGNGRGVVMTFATSGTENPAPSRIALQAFLNSGYTGTASAVGIASDVTTAGTGNDLKLGTAYANPFGNSGLNGFAVGTTTGLNVGSYAEAGNGNVNVGAVGKATTTKNSATNIGMLGVALNTGTSPIQVGGYFGLHSSTPTFASAALIADNGGTTSPIFVGRDNGSTEFQILDGGAVTIGTTSVDDTKLRVHQTTNVDSAAYISHSSANRNVLNLQHTNAAGYVNINFLDNSTNHKAGFGYGNGSAAASAVQGKMFLWLRTGVDFRVLADNLSTERFKITEAGVVSVGNAQEFAVSASGNITKINNVATSFPSSQGAANTVLANNGSGTLSWSERGDWQAQYKFAARSLLTLTDSTIAEKGWHFDSREDWNGTGNALVDAGRPGGVVQAPTSNAATTNQAFAKSNGKWYIAARFKYNTTIASGEFFNIGIIDSSGTKWVEFGVDGTVSTSAYTAQYHDGATTTTITTGTKDNNYHIAEMWYTGTGTNVAFRIDGGSTVNIDISTNTVSNEFWKPFMIASSGENGNTFCDWYYIASELDS